MATDNMSTFRYDSGERREVLIIRKGEITIFAHSTTKASDTTMAVKFLKTRMEGEIGSSPELYSKFIEGKLCLAVLSGEDVDQRLVDYFASLDHMPVHIISCKDSMDSAVNRLKSLPMITASDLSQARMKEIYDIMQGPQNTCVSKVQYDEMMTSYMTTPDNRKTYWQYKLYDRHKKPSKVVYRDGELYDTNIQTGKLQKTISHDNFASHGRVVTFFTEAGERFISQLG